MKRSERGLLLRLGNPRSSVTLMAHLAFCAANLKPRKGKKDYSELAYHCLVRATDGTKKLSTVVEVRRQRRRQPASKRQAYVSVAGEQRRKTLGLVCRARILRASMNPTARLCG
jgi:hypothetical protein